MKFLKPEIFYNDDQNSNKLKNLRFEVLNRYNEYLKSIESELPKLLLKYYHQTDRFHDCKINKIIYNGDTNLFAVKSDNIEINLKSYEEEINLFFDNVVYFKLENEIDLNSSVSGIEEITLCELGVTEKGYYSLEFHTSSGGTIIIQFKKIHLSKKKLR